MDEDLDDDTKFYIWGTVVIITTLAAITLTTGCVHFQSIRALMIVQKRYPKLVLLESALAITVTLCYFPLYMNRICQLNVFSEYQRYLTTITYLFYPLCHGIVFCECCRLWLMCFDINYAEVALKNREWRSKINGLAASNDWWIRNRRTFGNYNWVCRRCAICSVLSGTTSMTLFLLFGFTQWAQLIDGCLYGLPIIVILYAYYHCPRATKDVLLFDLEFKTTSILFTVALAVYFIAQVLWFLDVFLAQTLICIDGLIGLTFVSILSTLWVPRKILSKMVWWHQLYSQLEPESAIQSLIKTFDDCKSLELFAAHLNHEYSLELLLCFVECVQFKQAFFEEYFKQRCDAVPLEGHRVTFDFGDEPLQSEIVFRSAKFRTLPTLMSSKHKIASFGLDGRTSLSNVQRTVTLRKFKRIARLLFEKYIREGSELEINIPSQQRKEYTRLMHDEREWLYNTEVSAETMSTFYDEICLSQLQLMDHAFVRFKLTDEYKDLSVVKEVRIRSVTSTRQLQCIAEEQRHSLQ